MRKTKKISRIYLVLLVTIVAITAGSCSKTVRFQTSSTVPAARGKVKIKKDDNNNYSIDLEIKNLTEPTRLQPPKPSYVVWIETEKNGIKNIGSLKSAGGFFSSALSASLVTATAFKPTKVFITAEDNTAIQYPGPQVIITTKKF